MNILWEYGVERKIRHEGHYLALLSRRYWLSLDEDKKRAR